jgi:hypothetical protein
MSLPKLACQCHLEKEEYMMGTSLVHSMTRSKSPIVARSSVIGLFRDHAKLDEAPGFYCNSITGYPWFDLDERNKVGVVVVIVLHRDAVVLQTDNHDLVSEILSEGCDPGWNAGRVIEETCPCGVANGHLCHRQNP